MRFFQIFQLEVRRITKKKVIVLILLIFAAALALLQYGISEYKTRLLHEDIFKEIENKKVSLYQTYTQYGTYGFRIFYIPDLINIFFVDSGVFSDITANIDSGERLNIYNTFKGSNIFKAKKKAVVMDFSGILLFFGGLLSIFFGYASFQDRKYIKFYVSVTSRFQVFLNILAARILILSIFLFLILVFAFILSNCNGISLILSNKLVFYFLSLFLVLIFFTVLGIFLGTSQRENRLKNRIYSAGSLLACMVIFVFIVPTSINFITARKSNMIKPLYNLEMEKLTILMNFEKKAIEKAGTFDYNKKVTKPRQDVMKNYHKNEFVQIHNLEAGLREEMRGNVTFYHILSMIFPTTYYLATTEELSSCGYGSLLRFHRYSQNLKKKFFKFYMTQLYFMGNFSKVENFIKGNENVFRSESLLPEFYWLGHLLTVIYIIVLLTISYGQFNRLLNNLSSDELKRVNPKRIFFKRGDLEIHHSARWIMPAFLFSVFSGGSVVYRKKGYNASVKVDNQEYFGKSIQDRFCYICKGEDIPQDVVVKDFITLLKRILKNKNYEQKSVEFKYISDIELNKRLFELEDYQKAELLLYYLKQIDKGIVLIDDLGKDMPIEFLFDIIDCMKLLKARGVLVLYIYTDEMLPTRKRSIENNQLLVKSDYWLPNLEDIRKNMAQ